MATMTHSHLNYRPNIGKIDRALRFLVAAASVGVVIALYDLELQMPAVWTLLALFSIPIAASALVKWDPFYAMFHIRTTAADLWLKAGSATDDFRINLSVPRRVVRVVSAAGLIAGAMAFGGDTLTWEPYAYLASIPLAITGIIGWAPFEAMVKDDDEDVESNEE